MINLYSPLTVLTVITALLIVAFLTVKLTLLTNKIFLSMTPDQSGDIMNHQIDVAFPYKLIQARHGWMLVNPNDFYMGRSIVEYGESCELESKFLITLIAARPGSVVEIGANMGIHTVALAKALALENRKMIAFEPQQFIFQNLCANLALNGLTNTTAWPWACGAKTEIVHFQLPDYSAQGNFGGISMSAETSLKSVAVPCVRLDDVVEIGSVSLLKIDVEGYELLTLQGAVDVLTRSRPMLYVENDRVEKSQALIEWLWSKNYRLFWHIPRLFNPENFFENETNIYGNVASFNMLGVPRELEYSTLGMHEILSATDHPLAG